LREIQQQREGQLVITKLNGMSKHRDRVKGPSHFLAKKEGKCTRAGGRETKVAPLSLLREDKTVQITTSLQTEET